MDPERKPQRWEVAALAGPLSEAQPSLPRPGLQKGCGRKERVGAAVRVSAFAFGTELSGGQGPGRPGCDSGLTHARVIVGTSPSLPVCSSAEWRVIVLSLGGEYGYLY